MKKLIIINGPAGVGKSTVANILHEQIKPSYLLSCDSIRRFLNDYHDLPREGRTLRNKIVLNMLEALLSEDIIVILEQLHTDKKMIESYRKIGRKHKAEVHEIFLWVTEEQELLNRFHNRDKGEMRHPKSSLTDERVSRYWHKMKSFTEDGNTNSTIITDKQSPEKTVAEIQKIITS